MARGTKAATKPAAVEQDEDETAEEAAERAMGIERVISKREVQPNIQRFADWLVEQGGPSVKPLHLQLAIHGYKHFQRSDEHKEAREAEREERRLAQEARREEAQRRKEEAAERRAAAAKKVAAAEANPTPASKKTAADASRPVKKKAGKKKAAAF